MNPHFALSAFPLRSNGPRQPNHSPNAPAPAPAAITTNAPAAPRPTKRRRTELDNLVEAPAVEAIEDLGTYEWSGTWYAIEREGPNWLRGHRCRGVPNFYQQTVRDLGGVLDEDRPRREARVPVRALRGGPRPDQGLGSSRGALRRRTPATPAIRSAVSATAPNATVDEDIPNNVEQDDHEDMDGDNIVVTQATRSKSRSRTAPRTAVQEVLGSERDASHESVGTEEWAGRTRRQPSR